MPGRVSGIREWFRWYKTPDDKPLNAFGFDEAALPKAKTVEVIAETHAAWATPHGSIDGQALDGQVDALFQDSRPSASDANRSPFTDPARIAASRGSGGD